MEEKNYEQNNEIINCKNAWIKFSTIKPVITIGDLLNSKFSKKEEKKTDKFFWALKDITFSVKKGEMIGLIGKNGSGKSTLLRVIAKILPLDKGTINVATDCKLLSTGVGLKQELSGRENIFLGCLMLENSLIDIKNNFERIVEFSELGDHIERPIKYYSTGMRSKLMFTIATSFEPKFLLLDELLSGGDISFREKANKRMKEIITKSNGGVIATHDLGFVKEYCSKAIYLNNGEIKFFGESKKAVAMYLNDVKISKSRANEIHD